MWRKPVGEGAKRVTTEEVFIDRAGYGRWLVGDRVS
jgi:hypothetical protein